MATVYRAFDPNFMREVALRVMSRDYLDDATFQQRFKREAQTVAALEHRAIVPVYDYGEYNGRLYFVMRLMPGGSLADRLANGALTIAQIEHLLARVGAALDKAHAQGLIHRDLKPANILYDAEGELYLSDFGIVKDAHAETLTQVDEIVGTPAYMSPEQVRGQEALDGRTDIYALGAILFQMVTGRLPYKADSAVAMAMAHTTRPIPRLREVDAAFPPAFQTVIDRAMAKEREARYQSGTEMAAAFSQAAHVVGVAAPAGTVSKETASSPTPATTQAPAAAVRRRWPLFAGLVALVLLATAGGFLLFNALPLSGSAVTREAEVASDSAGELAGAERPTSTLAVRLTLRPMPA